MKKLLLYILFSLTVSSLFAQVPYSMGYCSGSGVQGGERKYSFNGGSLSNTHQPALDNKAMCGMRYDLLYISRVFTGDMFSSKGYFPDYVELKWECTSMADYVTRFKVYRKTYGSTDDSTLVAIVDQNDRLWRDEYAEANILYEYTLYAEGISSDFTIEGINFIQGVGFRMPTGRITGRITYEGGTAVENVKVVAETDDDLSGKSLKFDGDDYIKLEYDSSDELFAFENGFAFQTWYRPNGGTGNQTIFSKDGMFEVFYDADQEQVGFTVESNPTIFVDFETKQDTFFHVAASYDGDLASLTVLYSDADDDYYHAEQSVGAISPNTEYIYMGTNTSGEFLNGYMKEIRLWNTPLDSVDVAFNAYMYISGEEDGLTAYYRLNENQGSTCFDLARKGFEFYENHMQIHGATWDDALPLKSQLAYMGITNSDGNYIISGIPFATSGSTYRFTPMYGQHSFEPNEALLFLGTGENTHNGIDFVDKSSFTLQGNIKYRGTKFPVADVMIKIDDQFAVTSSGNVIVSDANGNFSVDVPIGEHFVTLEKYGHSFENEGRFPPPVYTQIDGKDTVLYETYDFQAPVSGLQYIDTTLIKVVGRVVGGPAQGAKTHVFGRSTNNIGQAEIVLKSQKEKDLAEGDTTNIISNEIYADKYVTDDDVVVEVKDKGDSKFTVEGLNPKRIKINPDPVTGEYVAYLLPEKYEIEGISAGDYTFGEEFKTTLDLSSAFIWQTESDTTIYKQYLSAGGDEITLYQIDSLRYQFKKDFIYRVNKPTVTVTNSKGSFILGDTAIYIDKNGVKDTVKIIDDKGDMLLKHQLFTQRGTYNLKIAVSETYYNNLTDVYDAVPVSDGMIEIKNNLATDNTSKELSLNADGYVIENFTAGLPSITGDYTQTVNIIAWTGTNNSVATEWLVDGEPFKAYVKGGLPFGTNYTTKGPNRVDVILRDPPGSESYAYFEKGQTISSTSQSSFEQSKSTSADFKFMLGGKIKTFAGVGAGVISEVEITNDVSTGLTYEHNYSGGSSHEYSITTSETWTTGDDPLYVGAQADLFVGHSENIVYGQAMFLDMISPSFCDGCSTNTLTSNKGESYQLGLDEGLRFSPEVATTFIYTQDAIEMKIIPDLENLRNMFFKTQPSVYVSHYEISNDLYGTDNTITSTSGDGRTITGDSYNFIVPADVPDDSLFVDSIIVYNQEIAGWIKWLKHNEQIKAEAVYSENFSFGGGVVYEKTTSYDTVRSSFENFDFMITPHLEGAFGGSFNKFGLQVTLREELGFGGAWEDSNDTTETKTYGYVLNDESQVDFLSVDVAKASDGFGPVFKIQGGQTSCPFEDASVSKYLDTETILSNATEQIERPFLKVDQAIVNDVPENQAASYTLRISNENDGFDVWFMLQVKEGSNPYGALVNIDGSPILDGRMVLVPAGQEMVKTITIEKTLPDVYEYQDIELVLGSPCQYDPTDNSADIFSSVFLTARFQPVCSEVNLSKITDQWVINTISGDEMPLRISDYNLGHSSFEKVLFQYKSASTSQWTTENIFYKNLSDYESASEPKVFLNAQSSYDFIWDMSSLNDRDYDIRVKSQCADGSENESSTLSGVKDMKRPKLFGSPQPADGVLSVEDEVMIQFDETIVEGLLTPYNFTVQGVLNGAEVVHNTSLSFNGESSYATVPNYLSLEDKSFTVEFWAKRDVQNASTILYIGESDDNRLQIDFTGANTMMVYCNGQSFETVETFTDDNWHHYAIVYDNDAQILEAYYDDVYILENQSVLSPPAGGGNLILGKGLDGNYFNGSIHDLRIWSKARALGETYAAMNTTLSGSEVNLLNYWPMEEAIGELSEDKVRNKHLYLYTTEWNVYPEGAAYEFDGTCPLEINTASSVVITDEMDYTIEFWFKALETGQPMTLFSNGKGDGTDYMPERSISIQTDENGYVKVYSKNGAVLSASNKSYCDGQWHHCAFILERQANSKLLLDGELMDHQISSDFSALLGVDMWLGARGYANNPNHFADFEQAEKDFKTTVELFLESQLAFNEEYQSVHYKYNIFEETVDVIPNYVGIDSVFGGSDFLFADNSDLFGRIDSVDFLTADFNDSVQTHNDTLIESELRHLTFLNVIEFLSHDEETPHHAIDTLFQNLKVSYDSLRIVYDDMISAYNIVYEKYNEVINMPGGIYSFDRHLTGSIDEVRIWKMAKTATQINLDKNAKLNGTEKGLVAYYPFETYKDVMGVPVLEQTLEDLYIPPFAGMANGGTATAICGDFSADAPNIKDVRKVSSVAFDWVVNDDKIIININEPDELIEKCILEFTVEDVEDVHENRLASPVTWTAFVNRNQVKWVEKSISKEKELYEPMTFEVEIQNEGGTQKTFELQGLPVWLTANPSSGDVDPLGSVTVTFTVNEALNIGVYNETVYLDAGEGTPEALAFDLNVYKPAPEWTVNPDDYEYSMNIIAQLSVDGVISMDENDMVAAFVGDECRGVVSLQYLEPYDMYEAFLDIYSNNESGEDIQLRVWNASEGVIHTSVLPDTLTFTANKIIGTPSAPITIEAANNFIQTIPLKVGWNWLSFNLSSSVLNSTDTLMSLIKVEHNDQIKSKEGYGQVYNKDGVFDIYGDLDNSVLENDRMYMINTSIADTLKYTGSGLDANQVPITIKEGWNWIGYPTRINMTVNDALAQFTPQAEDVVKSQTQFAMYVETLGWIGSLDYFVLGEGYMYKSNNVDPTEFTFPEKTLLKSGTEESVENFGIDSIQINESKYEHTMSLVASVSPHSYILDSCVLYAKVGDEFRGIIDYDKASGLFFMTIYADANDEKINISIINKETGFSYTFDRTIVFKTDDVQGNYASPIEFSLPESLLTAIDENAGEGSAISIFPNPFIDVFEVTYKTTTSGKITVELFDASGKSICQLGNFKVTVGENSIVIDTKDQNLPVGTYWVKINQNGNVVEKQLIHID